MLIDICGGNRSQQEDQSQTSSDRRGSATGCYQGLTHTDGNNVPRMTMANDFPIKSEGFGSTATDDVNNRGILSQSSQDPRTVPGNYNDLAAQQNANSLAKKMWLVDGINDVMPRAAPPPPPRAPILKPNSNMLNELAGYNGACDNGYPAISSCQDGNSPFSYHPVPKFPYSWEENANPDYHNINSSNNFADSEISPNILPTYNVQHCLQEKARAIYNEQGDHLYMNKLEQPTREAQRNNNGNAFIDSGGCNGLSQNLCNSGNQCDVWRSRGSRSAAASPTATANKLSIAELSPATLYEMITSSGTIVQLAIISISNVNRISYGKLLPSPADFSEIAAAVEHQIPRLVYAAKSRQNKDEVTKFNNMTRNDQADNRKCIIDRHNIVSDTFSDGLSPIVSGVPGFYKTYEAPHCLSTQQDSSRPMTGQANPDILWDPVTCRNSLNTGCTDTTPGKNYYYYNNNSNSNTNTQEALDTSAKMFNPPGNLMTYRHADGKDYDEPCFQHIDRRSAKENSVLEKSDSQEKQSRQRTRSGTNMATCFKEQIDEKMNNYERNGFRASKMPIDEAYDQTPSYRNHNHDFASTNGDLNRDSDYNTIKQAEFTHPSLKTPSHQLNHEVAPAKMFSANQVKGPSIKKDYGQKSKLDNCQVKNNPEMHGQSAVIAPPLLDLSSIDPQLGTYEIDSNGRIVGDIPPVLTRDQLDFIKKQLEMNGISIDLSNIQPAHEPCMDQIRNNNNNRSARVSRELYPSRMSDCNNVGQRGAVNHGKANRSETESTREFKTRDSVESGNLNKQGNYNTVMRQGQMSNQHNSAQSSSATSSEKYVKRDANNNTAEDRSISVTRRCPNLVRARAQRNSPNDDRQQLRSSITANTSRSRSSAGNDSHFYNKNESTHLGHVGRRSSPGGGHGFVKGHKLSTQSYASSRSGTPSHPR